MTLPSSATYLLARLAGVHIALPASSVKELVRAVALATVPGAPRILEGAMNLHGAIIPVLDLRVPLGLPARTNDPADTLIILETGARRLAVRVESVDDVEEIASSSIHAPDAMSPTMATLSGLAGIATRDDGAVIIYDPAAFLSQAEGDAIDAALAAHG
ncbi:MAG: chemotaxis protein CheW [bacterium]